MATTSMDLTTLVGKLLAEEDPDVLREGIIRVLVGGGGGGRGLRLSLGAGPYERTDQPKRRPQRLPDPLVGHPGGHLEPGHPQDRAGQLVPLPAGAQTASGSRP